MIARDGIRTFLESPLSMDLACPDVQKGCERAVVPRSRRRKRRKEALPPYIPYESVYVQSDLSKLTERQRIMALKFQTNITNVSKLFLEVNSIYLQTKKEGGRCSGSHATLQGGAVREAFGANASAQGCRDHGRQGDAQVNKLENKRLSPADNNGMYKFLQTNQPVGKSASAERVGAAQGTLVEFVPLQTKEDGAAAGRESTVPGAHAVEAGLIGPIRLKIRPLNVRLPFSSIVTCERCKMDVCDLLRFFSWAYGAHTCRCRDRIRQVRNKLAFLVGNSLCVCTLEEGFFDQAFEITGFDCC